MAKKPDGLSLGPNEKILWNADRAKRSFISSTGKGFKLMILLIFLFSVSAVLLALETRFGFGELCFYHLLFLGVIIVAVPFLFQKKYQYAITTERVYAKVGIGARRVNEIPIQRVVNTTYQQGILGRMLNFGDLQFNSAAGSDQGVVFRGVKNVKAVDQKFKEINSRYSHSDSVRQTVNIQSNVMPPPPPPQEPIKKADFQPVEDKAVLEDRDVKRIGPETGSEDKKFCKHCGAKIDPDSKYCEKCGKGV